MISYLSLKHAHAGLAYLSVTLFAVRAALSYARPAALQHKLLRIAPHAIDSVLLAAGVTLALWAGYAPHTQPWLLAKLLALPLYIVLGYVGLKKLHGSPWRAVVLGMALLVPLYMLAVAKTKLPWPF